MGNVIAKGLMMSVAATIPLNLLVTIGAGRQSEHSLGSRPTFYAGQNRKDKGKVSRAELVGTVLSNICRLSPDKDEVLTLYQVRVDEIREGESDELKRGIITVAVRGGLVMLKADETEVSEDNQLDTDATVEVEAPGEGVPLEGVAATKHTPFDAAHLMENGVSYVLRLEIDAKWEAYKLTVAPERAY